MRHESEYDEWRKECDSLYKASTGDDLEGDLAEDSDPAFDDFFLEGLSPQEAVEEWLDLL